MQNQISMAQNTPEKDILLAEDDIDDVTIFELALNELEIPYIMRHAKNGDVLFVMLKQRKPYILFLDINMPCKDGLACIAEIRKNREYDSLPVIMYTSLLGKKTIEDSFRGGANLYLSKTPSFDKLKENLSRIFSMDWNNHLHFPPLDQFVC